MAKTPRGARCYLSRDEALDLLEYLTDVLADITGRWYNGVHPELRAELMVRAYDPLISAMVKAGRRPRGKPS